MYRFYLIPLILLTQAATTADQPKIVAYFAEWDLHRNCVDPLICGASRRLGRPKQRRYPCPNL
jgi:hypothetical protein